MYHFQLRSSFTNSEIVKNSAENFNANNNLNSTYFLIFTARSYDSPRSSYSGDHGHRGYPDRAKGFNAESMDWQKAAEAWARSKSRDGTPRSEGRNTPRSGKQTPRSTPRSTRTNMSPSSMILGDATPLYDESI